MENTPKHPQNNKKEVLKMKISNYTAFLLGALTVTLTFLIMDILTKLIYG
jgi:hypothetical protein